MNDPELDRATDAANNALSDLEAAVGVGAIYKVVKYIVQYLLFLHKKTRDLDIEQARLNDELINAKFGLEE